MPATLEQSRAGTGELRFDDGLPGFPAAHRFTLSPWGSDDSVFSVLQSADDPDLRFVVVPPELFFPDYAPEIGDDDADRLGLETADDAILLVVVSLGQRAADATANLLGPIVVNRHTLAGAQVVCSQQDLPTRAPLAGG